MMNRGGAREVIQRRQWDRLVARWTAAESSEHRIAILRVAWQRGYLDEFVAHIVDDDLCGLAGRLSDLEIQFETEEVSDGDL